MLTTATSHAPNDQAQVHQLVLFPDVLGVSSLPLALCYEGEVTPESEEPAFSACKAVEAGQLPLFC